MVENIATNELIATTVFSWWVSLRATSLLAKLVTSRYVLAEYRLATSTLPTAHLYRYAVMPDTMTLVMLKELTALI